MEKLYSMPTEHSIRMAAEKCPEARIVLQELFPQAFITDSEFQVGDIISADCTKHRDSGKKTGTAFGIIKLIHPSMRLGIGVEFFEPVRGHTLERHAVDYHGWWHAEDEITFVFRPRDDKKAKEKQS